VSRPLSLKGGGRIYLEGATENQGTLLSLLINSLTRISSPDIMILCQDKQELIFQEIFRENRGTIEGTLKQVNKPNNVP